MDSTKNEKGNRLVLIAEYEYKPYTVFAIPDGLDLKDKNIVKKYWTLWNNLHIEYVDGRIEKIEAHYEYEDNRKYPSELNIESAEGHYDYDEEEEEEENPTQL